MKCLLVFLLAAPAAMSQTGTASIQGTVVDAKTRQPIPAALVMAVRTGPPPFTRNTRTGGAGEFQIQGLTAGNYTLCVQARGDGYLDPCQWNGGPTTVTLVSGQAVTAVTVRLAAASVMRIQVQDAQKILGQKTKDGRLPELSVGVWGPKGLYYPARSTGSPGTTGTLQTVVAYQITVPRDMALNLHIASRDLRLGDAAGASLPANASQQAFQHATGDANPKSFAFTVLGFLP